MTTRQTFEAMSDPQVLAEAKRLAGCERQATADLIAALMELDARRLYLGEGCASLFTYCTRVLRLSEHAAYGRIEAARAARQHPAILDLLRDGALTLTTIALLRPHLTAANERTLLEAARHKSKREVEELVATLRPRPEVTASVRKLPVASRPAPVPTSPGSEVPTQKPLAASAAQGQTEGPDTAALQLLSTPEANPMIPRASVVNLSVSSVSSVTAQAPNRYRVQLTISRETHDKLRRVQDLLRHSIPKGDLAAVFDRAVSVLVGHLEKTKLATTSKPKRCPPSAAGSRRIPAPVRRAVWARDGARCAFVGREGRCEETGLLELHHRVPYADGGTRRSRTSNCAAGRTTCTRRSAGSGRWCGKRLRGRGAGLGPDRVEKTPSVAEAAGSPSDPATVACY